MEGQVEYSTSATLSLTPRFIAVKGERLGSKTVSTVFLPAQMFSRRTSARPTINGRMKIGQLKATVIVKKEKTN
jgi:hypothetical protein